PLIQFLSYTVAYHDTFFKTGDKKFFYSAPDGMDKRAGNDLVHFAIPLARIVLAFFPFYHGSHPAGRDRIEVYRHYRVEPVGHQVDKDLYIDFEIKQLTFFEPYFQPFTGKLLFRFG